MATDRDVHDARTQGEQAGYQHAVQQLRQFTGVTYLGNHGQERLEPDLDLPEHIAYPVYRKELAYLEGELDAEKSRMQGVAEDARARFDKSQHDLDDYLAERRASREGSSALVRAAGWAKDQAHPLRGEVKALEQQWTRRRDRWWNVIADHKTVRDELGAVDKWLTDAAVHIAEAEADRVKSIADAHVEATAARRDSSPRWCTVLTREDFLAGDKRRQEYEGEGAPIAVGPDFGHDWRRDSDDVGGRGIWELHWISQTQETFLEANDAECTIWILGTGVKSEKEADGLFKPLLGRMRERNSVGLILNAYGERFGPDDW